MRGKMKDEMGKMNKRRGKCKGCIFSSLIFYLSSFFSEESSFTHNERSIMLDRKHLAAIEQGAGILKCFVVKFCRHQGRVMSYV